MGAGAVPLCSLLRGERLGYVEARLRIYAPLYAECVEKYESETLDELRELRSSGKDIALFDFDGYDHVFNAQTLTDVMYNTRRKMGHAFVLAALITGDRPWDGHPYDASREHSTPIKRARFD
jgi:hypothetical protein